MRSRLQIDPLHWNIKDPCSGYNEDDLDKDGLAFLLDNEMDIQDQEFTLNEVHVAVSTSNDQATIELANALEDQKPLLPVIAEKLKHRFKSLTGVAYNNKEKIINYDNSL